MSLVDAQVPAHMLTRLRVLRQWHFDEYKRWQRLSEKHEELGTTRPNVLRLQKVRAYRSKATTHINAVQTLNDLFPLGDYAK